MELKNLNGALKSLGESFESLVKFFTWDCEPIEKNRLASMEELYRDVERNWRRCDLCGFWSSCFGFFVIPDGLRPWTRVSRQSYQDVTKIQFLCTSCTCIMCHERGTEKDRIRLLYGSDDIAIVTQGVSIG